MRTSRARRSRSAGAGGDHASRRARELVVRELDSQLPRRDVEHDDVAVLDGGERAAVECLGRHVADHEAVRRAGEAAVRDERDRVGEPLADDRGGHVQHLAHARAAGRALVADHDDVAGQDRASLDGGEAGLLGVEDARRAAVHEPVVARELDDAPSGRGCRRGRAGRRSASAAARAGRRPPGRAAPRPRPRSRRASGRPRSGPSRPASGSRLSSSRASSATPPASCMSVGDEAAAGLEAREHRRPRRDRVEVVERVRDAELTRDREQVQDAVRRAAAGRDRRRPRCRAPRA